MSTNRKLVSTFVALSLAAGGALVTGCAGIRSDHDDDDKMEQEIPIGEVPAAVMTTLKKEAGAGTIEEVEKTKSHGAIAYEADVIVDGKKWEICVRQDGQLLRKELDEEKDDEDDDGKK